MTYLKHFVSKYIGSNAGASNSGENQLFNLTKSPEQKPCLFSKTEILKFEQVQGYSQIDTCDPDNCMNSYVAFYIEILNRLEQKKVLNLATFRFEGPVLATLQKDGIEISLHDPSQFTLSYPDGISRSILIQIEANTGREKLSSFTKFGNGDFEIYTFAANGSMAKIYNFSSKRSTEIIYFDEEKTEYVFEEDGQVETIYSNGLKEILTKDCRTEFRPDNTSINIYSSGVQETTFLDGSRLLRLKDGIEIKVNEYGQLQGKITESQLNQTIENNSVNEEDLVESENDTSFDPNKTDEEHTSPNRGPGSKTTSSQINSQTDEEGGQEEIEYEEVVEEEEEQSLHNSREIVKSVKSGLEEDGEDEIVYEEVTEPEEGEEEVIYEEVEVTDEDTK